MNGLADQIPRAEETLEQRGIPAGSFFEVAFVDGSVVTEKEVNWSDMAVIRRVRYFGGTKTVFVSKLHLACITVYHEGMEAHVDVPEGCEGYQAIRSEARLIDGRKEQRIIGRVVGIVKDGEVIEEQFINEVEHTVLGTRN